MAYAHRLRPDRPALCRPPGSGSFCNQVCSANQLGVPSAQRTMHPPRAQPRPPPPLARLPVESNYLSSRPPRVNLVGRLPCAVKRLPFESAAMWCPPVNPSARPIAPTSFSDVRSTITSWAVGPPNPLAYRNCCRGPGESARPDVVRGSDVSPRRTNTWVTYLPSFVNACTHVFSGPRSPREADSAFE